jgi:RNA polymerase sigma factor (sigma-70 family)
MKTSPEPIDLFDEFAEAIRPQLLRLVSPMLGGTHEAEDVVQEALLGLWQRRGQVEDWAAYAARATWLNGLKRRGRKKDWIPLQDWDGASDAPAPEMETWGLEQAIAGLPLAQQAVIRMRFYAGQSFREIGGALQISLHTAASRCRYAIQALRLALNEQEIEATGGGKRGKQRVKGKQR